MAVLASRTELWTLRVLISGSPRSSSAHTFLSRLHFTHVSSRTGSVEAKDLLVAVFVLPALLALSGFVLASCPRAVLVEPWLSELHRLSKLHHQKGPLGVDCTKAPQRSIVWLASHRSEAAPRRELRGQGGPQERQEGVQSRPQRSVTSAHRRLPCAADAGQGHHVREAQHRPAQRSCGGALL